MIISLWALIFGGVVLFLAWPLLWPAPSAATGGETEAYLLARKEEAYAALKDIELDYQMGKLSEEDYIELREKYRLEALALLDQIEKGDEIEELLEREVKALRRERKLCPACGTEKSPASRFCRTCGAPLLLTLALVLLLLLSAPARAALLEGKLMNRTPGGRGVGDVEITLIESKGGQENKQTTKSDRSGVFRFSNLSSQKDFRVNLRYQGAEYDVGIAFKPGEEKRRIDIPVYDSTEDPSALRVKEHHFIVEPGEDLLMVNEFLLVENKGERAFIGSRPADSQRLATLQFTLPRGAAELKYGSGLMDCCVVPVESGFVDTMDVKPGVREINFSYALRPGSNQFTYVRPLDYPSDGVNLFIKGETKAESPTLKGKEVVEVQGQRYLRLSGKDLAPGTSLEVVFGELPLRSNFIRYIVFAAVALFLAAGMAYGFIWRRSGPRPAIPTFPETLKARYDELIEALAKLDDAFEAGKLNSEEYRKLRAERKTDLSEIAKRIRNLG